RATGKGAGVRAGAGRGRRPQQEGAWAARAGGRWGDWESCAACAGTSVVASPEAEAAAGARGGGGCEARAVVLSSFPSLAGGGGRSGAGRSPPSSPCGHLPRPSRAARSLRRKTVPARIWLVDSRRFSLSRKMPKSKLDKRRNKDMTKRLLPKLP
ncbi:unnamed protein product, partial [Gulo gulo]